MTHRFHGTRYGPEIVPVVQDALERGLWANQIEALPGMPEERTIWRMIEDNPEVSLSHTRGKRLQALRLIDEAQRCVDSPLPDDARFASASVTRSSNMAEFRWRKAERLDRATWGPPSAAVTVNVGLGVELSAILPPRPTQPDIDAIT